MKLKSIFTFNDSADLRRASIEQKHYTKLVFSTFVSYFHTFNDPFNLNLPIIITHCYGTILFSCWYSNIFGWCSYRYVVYFLDLNMIVNKLNFLQSLYYYTCDTCHFILEVLFLMNLIMQNRYYCNYVIWIRCFILMFYVYEWHIILWFKLYFHLNLLLCKICFKFLWIFHFISTIFIIITTWSFLLFF